MSRLFTRKGVALGAGISLLASGLFATPAFAAAGVESDSQGTAGVYGMVAGTSFKLLVNGNSEFPAGNAGLLRIHVKNLNGQTASGFTFSTTNANNVPVDGVYNTTDDDVGEGDDSQPGNLIITGAGAAKGSTDASVAGTVDAVAVLGLGASSYGTNNVPNVDSVSAMTSPFTFSFTSGASAGTPAVYEVTAFVDTNNNAVMDAGEMKAPTRNVTFYNQADLTSTVTLNPMLAGDTQITGYAVINNVDMKQIDARRAGIWLEDINGSTIGHGPDNLVIPGTLGTDGAASEVQYDSTDKRFEFKTRSAVGTDATALAAALVAGKSVRANFLLDSATSGVAVGDKITTTGSGNIGARTSGSLEVDTVDSETTATVAASGSQTVNVLLNSTYAVKAIVKDTATPAAALAGKAVTAKITSSRTLSSSITVTVNGTKYSSNATLPGATGVASVALTTDAKGEAVVNVTTAGLTAGDDIVVEFTTDNRVETITTNNAAADYTAFITNAIDAVSTTDGTAAAVTLSVRDQFGGKPANNTLRVVSSFDGSGAGYSAQAGGASTSASSSFADVSNGEATLSILDNGTGAGVNIYDLDLKTLASDGTYSATEVVAANFQVQVRTAANLAVGTLTVGSANSQNATTEVYSQTVTGDNANLFLSELFAHNSRTSIVSAPAKENADNVDGETVSGVVSTTGSAIAAATPIAGVAVTISGAGLLFKTTDQNSTTRYAVGSITVRSNNAGQYSVVVYSNKAGKQTLTITAGSQSETVVLDAFDAAAADSGDALTIVAPKSLKSGRTLTVTARLVDEWGNPVAVPNTSAGSPTTALAYSGPGFTTTVITQTLNASGESTFRVLLGSLDTGIGSLSFSYDADGTTADIDAKSVTKAVWFGPIANASAAAKKGNVVVDVYRAKGKTVKVYVGKTLRATFVADKANDKFVLKGVKSGARNLKVRLSGPGEDFAGAISVK